MGRLSKHAVALLAVTLMMQMAASIIVSLFLFCCSFTSTEAKDTCEAYAPVGGSFVVPLQHKLQTLDNLRWKHNKTKIFHRLSNETRSGKPDDINRNGSLRLTNLKRSSEGLYIPEVFNTNGEPLLNGKGLYLCILDPVPKPGLQIECVLPNVKFTCIPGKTAYDTLEWFQNDKPLSEENEKTVLRVASEVPHYSFKCKISNRVSSMNSESLIQNCMGSSESIFPKELFGLDFRIMASILASLGGLALLLIIILFVCCIRAIKEKQKQVKEEEELRLGWTNSEGQHQHRHQPPKRHHHCHGQTGPRQHRSRQHREPRYQRSKPQARPRSDTQP
nr:T-cell surface antigen CD2-like [Nerophis lumbriciformis]